MEFEWTKLPLYDSWDYNYSVSIANQNITFEFYYNDRNQVWSFAAYYSDDVAIVEGQAISPLKPMMLDMIPEVGGFLWLEPISQEINEATLHPSLLHKYYNLYYIR